MTLDHLVYLARAFNSHHLSAQEFRRALIDAVATADANSLLELALFFNDVEMDDNERDVELIRQ